MQSWDNPIIPKTLPLNENHLKHLLVSDELKDIPEMFKNRIFGLWQTSITWDNWSLENQPQWSLDFGTTDIWPNLKSTFTGLDVNLDSWQHKGIAFGEGGNVGNHCKKTGQQQTTWYCHKSTSYNPRSESHSHIEHLKRWHSKTYSGDRNLYNWWIQCWCITF